ncbi:MAG: class I SAM-dependent methyltransferase [Leptospirillum sp.]
MKIDRPCPVCNSPSNKALLFLEENIDKSLLSDFSFASRKEPEYMCHHLVRCPLCDLIYASRPPEQDELAKTYHLADYDSSEDATDAATSYLKSIEPIIAKLSNLENALEIGTGNGAFLDHLIAAGFKNVLGIEPSSSAISAAPEYRKHWIREGIFRESDYDPESFDLICCFMTLEHVSDPREIANSVLRLLRPGGVFITVTHDHNSFVNRILGKKSPIIDIEHLQLFSPQSIKKLFTGCGYSDVSVRSFSNTYALRYWLRLAPIPKKLKSALLSFLSILKADQRHLSFNVGNIITVGYRSKK